MQDFDDMPASRFNTAAWPQDAVLLWRDELELVIFMNGTSDVDEEAVHAGRVEFAICGQDRLHALLCCRLEAPPHASEISWRAAPFYYHEKPESDRVPPPNPGGLEPGFRASLRVLLVDRSRAGVRARREVRLSSDMTRSLFEIMARQASTPTQEFDRLPQRFSDDYVAGVASIRCEGES